MKKIICYFLGHDWTSKAMRGEKPSVPLSIDGFRDHAKMYCGRCGKVSKLNGRLTPSNK